MTNYTRRAWAAVDLDAVAHNFGAVRGAVPAKTEIISVVKADAYGHGAEMTAKELERLGTDRLAVSGFDEAEALRRQGVGIPILILGYTPPEMVSPLCALGLTATVFDRESAAALSDAAVAAGVTAGVHIKIDTGMSRLGIRASDLCEIAGAADAVMAVHSLPGLRPEGIFTHFSKADEPADGFTDRQFNLFTALLERLERLGVRPGLRHCANSAAVCYHPKTALDAVRPGIILYGLYPESDEASGHSRELGLRPAMSFKTVISQVKDCKAGGLVGYGGRYILPSDGRIGVIPVGYADGYSRALSDRAEVLVGGGRAGVIGRVCMDMTVIDLNGLPLARPGEEVTLFGEGLPIERLSRLCGTISYELCCLIGKRVPRVYISGGREVKAVLAIGG